jgi:plastocyanin
MFSRLSFLLLAAALPATAQEPAKPAEPVKPAAEGHGHESGTSPTSGLKKELIAGLTEKDFIKLGDKEKTVKVLLVATWSDENYGMNFNGHAKGAALYTIPKGWTVEVTFINPGPVPHSLIVIEKEAVKKIQMPEPYFTGAAVEKHLQGISYGKASFTFTADEAGEYAFACGFPAHAINGHWVGLDISEEAKVPTLKLGEKAAVEAVK